MNNFTANFALGEFDEESEIEAYRARLADKDRDTERYLQFELQTNPSEDDISFGFHLPHIEICGQGFSGYGLVNRVLIRDHKLTVFFNDKGRQALQATEPYRLPIDRSLNLTEFVVVLEKILEDRLQDESGR